MDFEDNHHVETEWDEWDQLVQDGYECFDEQKADEGLEIWGKAWSILQAIMEQQDDLLRKATWGVACNEDNSFLFARAKQLAQLGNG